MYINYKTRVRMNCTSLHESCGTLYFWIEIMVIDTRKRVARYQDLTVFESVSDRSEILSGRVRSRGYF